MMIHARLLRMTVTRVKAHGLGENGVRVPDVLVVKRHRVERAKHHGAVAPDSDRPERRAGARSRLLRGIARYFKDGVLDRRSIWVRWPRPDRIRRYVCRADIDVVRRI